MSILVTGTAGFIGFHVAKRLLDEGHDVVGVDNLTPYYSVALKTSRLDLLRDYSGFTEERLDLAVGESVDWLFAKHDLQEVVHLAAQAGVRHSMTHPQEYIRNNLMGFANLVEACRRENVQHLVFASSSSVYGANATVPFSVRERVDEPMNLYAATKKANEVLAYSYSYLHGLPATGLRFFTVYGPWGRPDMAYYRWADAITQGREIDLHNDGNHWRDFTYITDIVEGVVSALRASRALESDDAKPDVVPFRLYNLGNHKPVHLMQFLNILEGHLGISAKVRKLPYQRGEAHTTFADIQESTTDLGFLPTISVQEGLGRFVQWYMSYSDQSRTAAEQPAAIWKVPALIPMRSAQLDAEPAFEGAQ